MLGYDVYEDDRTFEKKGLTGEVSRYGNADISYPCYIIEIDKEHPLETYKLQVLKNMFITVGNKHINVEENNIIHLYASGDNKVATLGNILSLQVKSVLKLLETNNVIGYLDENTKLTGNMLYVLSN